MKTRIFLRAEKLRTFYSVNKAGWIARISGRPHFVEVCSSIFDSFSNEFQNEEPFSLWSFRFWAVTFLCRPKKSSWSLRTVEGGNNDSTPLVGRCCFCISSRSRSFLGVFHPIMKITFFFSLFLLYFRFFCLKKISLVWYTWNSRMNETVNGKNFCIVTKDLPKKSKI